jgi:hypothetical protein
MYYALVKENLIHAADSVELMANMQGVTLRTKANATPHQMYTQGANVFQAKGPVVFHQKVEYVLQEMEFDNGEADWKMRGALKEIEAKPEKWR